MVKIQATETYQKSLWYNLKYFCGLSVKIDQRECPEKIKTKHLPNIVTAYQLISGIQPRSHW